MNADFDAREDFLATQSLAFALFCRACATEPDDAFLELLCGDAIGELLSLEGSRCSWAEDVEAERAALGEEPAEAALDGLRTDYTALFLGPKTLPAPIWETVYRTGRSELFTKVTLEVRAQYRRHGFSTEAFPHTADDHIAVEFAFLSSLAQAALLADAQADEAQLRAALMAEREFLREHLNRWLKECAEKMLLSRRKRRLYPALMAFAAQFCHHCVKDLDVMLD